MVSMLIRGPCHCSAEVSGLLIQEGVGGAKGSLRGAHHSARVQAVNEVLCSLQALLCVLHTRFSL